MAQQPETARRLATILQSAGRGADLVQRLLAFARKQALAPTQIDLNRLVRGMRDLLAATLGRGIRVETKLQEALWPALADPVQIEHVILNLAINARDAMPNGGTLTIATTNSSLDQRSGAALDLPAGEYVAVAVSDTGTGMTDEVLRNAFEPFFTTKPPGQGSGLGLSQVYGVANQSDGGVRIESKVGVGTTVSVLLPRAESIPEPQSGLARTAQTIERLRASQKRTILVVDDEPECRATIADMLLTNEYAPVIAESGHDALRLIDDGATFDLLLADYNMPRMTGIELADEVRKRWPTIPVVFLTGADGDWIAGERWVLAKPFLTRSLIEMLDAALGHAQQGDAVHQTTSLGA
jgi:CheY-like chemotaxis protein